MKLFYISIVFLIILQVSLSKKIIPNTSQPGANNEITLKEVIAEINTLKEDKGSVIAAYIASGVAFFAAILSFFQFYKNREDQKTLETTKILIDSLKWFEGGIQKRGIGISIIEGYWKYYEYLRPMWVSLLINQAIHLLERSDQGNDPNETDNLSRIMNILKVGQLSQEQKNIILASLAKARTYNNINTIGRTTGIILADNLVKKWILFF